MQGEWSSVEEVCTVSEHRHGSVCPSGALSLSVSGCVRVWSSLRGEADRAHGSNMENLHTARSAPVHTHIEKTVSAECHY